MQYGGLKHKKSLDSNDTFYFKIFQVTNYEFQIKI